MQFGMLVKRNSRSCVAYKIRKKLKRKSFALCFFAVNDFIVGADAFDDVTAMTRHMENIVPSIVSDDDSK